MFNVNNKDTGTTPLGKCRLGKFQPTVFNDQFRKYNSSLKRKKEWSEENKYFPKLQLEVFENHFESLGPIYLE